MNYKNYNFGDLETLTITKIKDSPFYNMLAIYKNGTEVEIPRGKYVGELNAVWNYHISDTRMNISVEALRSVIGEEPVRIKTPTQEMTIEEVEAKLGHKVKIVNK